MKTDYGTICVGGGAAGLYFASLVPDCLLLEKTDRVGSKLLLTGGGMCNFTHEGEPYEIVEHYYDRKLFASPSIYNHPPKDIIRRFEELGVPSFTREDGCVFPRSRKAEDVVNALKGACSEIRTNSAPVSIRKVDGRFVVRTKDAVYTCDNVVLATGGDTWPETGSTGDAASYVKIFGNRVTSLRPGLCQLRLKDRIKNVEGVSVNDLNFTLDGKHYCGSVLFTRIGITGPVVLNASRNVGKTSRIAIHFTDIRRSEIKTLPQSKVVSNAITERTGLPESIVKSLVLPIAYDKRIAQLTKEEIARIHEQLTNYRTSVSTWGEGKKGMVTCGGVDTVGLDSKTLQSKTTPGFYAIGECVDVDGECGGYNLTFAFASAYTAAQSILKDRS